MVNFDFLFLAGIVAILVLLWNLHGETRALLDRVSRLEGSIKGLRSAIAERKS